MLEFNPYNIIKVKSDFILNKLTQITGVPILSFLQKMHEIDNKYKTSSPMSFYCYDDMLHISCKPSDILCI